MLALARYTALNKLCSTAAPAGNKLHYIACGKVFFDTHHNSDIQENWFAGAFALRSITARVPTHEDDTHEDFKPKFNPDAEPRSASSVTEQIEQDVKQNPVFLYMKVRL